MFKRCFYFLQEWLTSLLFFLYTGFCAFLCLLAAWGFPYKRTFQDRIIFFWGKGCVFFSQLKILVKGKDNVPKGKGVLYLFNHTSFLDIPLINFVLPHLRFGAKSEIFKIPIFGYVLKKIGSLVIERKAPRKVFDLYKKSILRVLAGESFALAPEGTRQDGLGIKAFKRGPFVFALEGKLTILPVVLYGMHSVWPKGRRGFRLNLKKKKIYVHILSPVETHFMDKEDLNSLKEKVHVKMIKAYEDLRLKAH